MSTPAIYPQADVETACIDYLKHHPAVTPALVDARNIGADLPPKATVPAITVTLVPSPPAVERFLVGAVVQFDAYGGTREQARQLAITAHAALVEMVGAQRNGAIVSGVATLLSPGKFPEPSRPRYMFQLRIWAHP